MRKAKGFILNHRFLFISFGFLLVYNLVITGAGVPWHIDAVSKGYYVLDFSMGFTDRILPGAVYNLFFDDLSDKSLSIYHTVIMIMFFIILSVLVDQAIRSVEIKDQRLYCILFLLLLSGPCTFSLFVHYLGMIEFYWVIFAVVFFLFLAYKPLQFLIVPLCLLVLLVSSVGIVTFVPFFCILMLYKLSLEESKRAKRVLFGSFLLCVCVSIPFALYLLAQSKNNLAISSDELYALLLKKGVVNPDYYEYFLFHRLDHAENAEGFLNDRFIAEYISIFFDPTNGIKTIVYKLLLQIRAVILLSMHREWTNLLFISVLTAPVWFIILQYMIKVLRDRQNSLLKRFSFLCMIGLFVLIIIVGLIMSVEHSKWFSFAFLLLFSCFLYVYNKEDAAKQYVVNCASKIPVGVTFVYCAVYALTVFSVFD